MPDVLPMPTIGRCESHRMEALQAASKITADLAYIDPPYNQHSYLGNYHIWGNTCSLGYAGALRRRMQAC